MSPSTSPSEVLGSNYNILTGKVPDLKRKTSETRLGIVPPRLAKACWAGLGISLGYVYDAAGQIIKTTRTGTNGTVIVTCYRFF